MHQDNLAAGNKFGLRHGFKVCTGARYLGDFIGYDESKCYWLKYWMLKWEKNRAITKTVGVSLGELRQGGLSDTIVTYIFSTRDKRHRISICGSGEHSWGIIVASSVLWKIEISPTHCSNLKYYSGQLSWPRSTRPGDILQREISKFDMCKLQDNWSPNRRDIIFHHRSPSGIQGRKVVKTINPGWR